MSAIEEQLESALEILEERENQYEFAQEQQQVLASQLGQQQQDLSQLDRMIDRNSLRKETLEKELREKKSDSQNQDLQLQEFDEDLSRSLILLDSRRVRLTIEQRTIEELAKEKIELERQQVKAKKKHHTLVHEQQKFREQKIRSEALLTSLSLEGEVSPPASEILAKIATLDPALHQRLVLVEEQITLKPHADSSDSLIRALETWLPDILLQEPEDITRLEEILLQEDLGQLKVSVQREQKSPALSPRHGQSILQLINCRHQLVTEFLGNCYYSLTTPTALDQSRLATEQVLLTPQGAAFSSTHMLVGPDKELARICRADKITTLGGELKKAETLLSTNRDELENATTAQQQLAQRLHAVEDESHKKSSLKIELVADITHLEASIAKEQGKAQELRTKAEGLEDQVTKIATELAEVYRNNQKIDEEKSELLTQMADLRESLEGVNDQIEEYRTIMEATKVENAAATSQAAELQERMATAEINFSSQRELTAVKSIQMKESEQKISDLTASMGSIRQNLVQTTTDLTTLNVQHTEKQEGHAELLRKIKIAEEAAGKFFENLDGIRSGRANFLLDQERVTANLAKVRELAFEKYNIVLDNHLQQTNRFDKIQQGKVVQEIKRKIDAFGPINMIAIEEYDRLKKRYDFIREQQEEVLSSLSLLDIAIEEIEISCIKRFQEVFETLNEQFQLLFPVLFPNGEATLEMTEPDKLLDSGVEILVRLPGKNRQSMRLFSGGERALTAIALIFALLKTKPTPFCFLDEVDAALDETNVSRYNTLLEKLRDQFQFIVITHRRRTMEVLDTLYGVTMQEPGVSKMVGVDLNKTLPTHLRKGSADNAPKTH